MLSDDDAYVYVFTIYKFSHFDMVDSRHTGWHFFQNATRHTGDVCVCVCVRLRPISSVGTRWQMVDGWRSLVEVRVGWPISRCDSGRDQSRLARHETGASSGSAMDHSHRKPPPTTPLMTDKRWQSRRHVHLCYWTLVAMS